MTAVVSGWQQKLEKGWQSIDARFAAGGDIFSLLRARARLADSVLGGIWKEERELRHSGLFAVGGYGRGELFPFSDIDVMILHPGDAMPRQAIESFLSHAWDVGLRPSHSVRSLDDCGSEAAADLTVLTAMLEARQLCGAPAWNNELQELLLPAKVWPVPEFFRARIKEQCARRDRFAKVAHNLEPSIKECCGGLRDLHMLCWMSLRCFAEGGIAGLHRNGMISTREKRELRDALAVLSKMRYALHLVAARAEERLLFEYQGPVAAAVSGDGSQKMVEEIMRTFHRATGIIDLYNEIVMRDFEQRLLPPSRPRLRALNKNFVSRDGRLELRSDKIPRQQPQVVLEAFILLARQPRLRVDADTTRRIRDYVSSHGAVLRDCAELGDYLLQLFNTRKAGRVIRLMHRYGVLDALLPPMAQVRGLTQFDLFHVHSVDVHTLCVLENLDGFFARREDEYAEYHGLAKNITRPEILYLAAMFHDIGKGRGGNHSLLGADEAKYYCQHWRMDSNVTQMVAWLVQNHLLMSHTSQRKDIDDAGVCDNFASQVEDTERLNYLYLLTAADIRGTNPALWNNWKHHLLSTLYRRAFSRLRRSQDKLPQTRLRQRREKALSLLSAKDATAAARLWRNWHQDIFRRYQPEEIALQTRHVLRNLGQQVLMLLQPRSSRSCTEVFLYMPARDDSFVVVTRVLDELNLDVVDARIITRQGGKYALDNYAMLERDGSCVRGRARIEEIRAALHKALRQDSAGKPVLPPPVRLSSRLRHFKVATEVSFSTGNNQERIIMEVTALDQPGLLCRIAAILYHAAVPLLGARVATFGERAEDVFYLPPGVSPRCCEQLRQDIIDATTVATVDTMERKVS